MKLRHYIFALGLMSSLGACNDDFMERYPWMCRQMRLFGLPKVI